MKFLYGYKTKDNERRNGEICAASREAVYAELKKSGIRPFSVVLAPGIGNRILSLGKRGFVIVALALVAMVAAFAAVMYHGRAENAEFFRSELDSAMRRQLIGDSAIIEKGIRTGWADVFAEEGDRFLASFAIPGVPAAVRNTTEDKIRAAMEKSVKTSDADGIEARQIKSIVEGMKRDISRYLSKGGSIVGYGRRLVQRQEEELGYYYRAKTAVERAREEGMSAADVEAMWETCNKELRQMGIKLVPNPNIE